VYVGGSDVDGEGNVSVDVGGVLVHDDETE
jgi:hypothetical protein